MSSRKIPPSPRSVPGEESGRSASTPHATDSSGARAEEVASTVFEAAADMVTGGDAAGLTALLDRRPGLVRARSRQPHRATLLHYAAANGVEDHRQLVPANAVEIGDLLIGRGGDINARCGMGGGGPGSTVLVALVTSGHPREAGLMAPLVRAWARGGGNLNGVGDDGLPMTYAFLFRNLEAAATLAECGARVDSAATAAGLGRVDLLEELVTPGTPPTADPTPLREALWIDRAPEGVPALGLFFASIAGEREAAAWLLHAGVDPKRTIHHGMTAMHEAALGGHLEIVRLLVEAGADTGAVEGQHQSTPPGWAVYAGHRHVAAYLAEAAAGLPDGKAET